MMRHDPATLPWWMAPVVVLAILMLHAAVNRLISTVVAHLGWTELARAYPETLWTEWPEDAAMFSRCGGRIGKLSQYSSLTVVAARTGIHVSTDSPFLACSSHPPFVLPWAEVQSVAAEGAGRSRRTVVRFVGATGLRARLDLPADALEEVRAASGRSFG